MNYTVKINLEISEEELSILRKVVDEKAFYFNEKEEDLINSLYNKGVLYKVLQNYVLSPIGEQFVAQNILTDQKIVV